MESEEQIIDKDKRANPNCTYSISSSQTCSTSQEGEFVCESIRKIHRLCPNKAPTIIFKSKSNELSDPSSPENVFGAESLLKPDDIFGGLLSRRHLFHQIFDGLFDGSDPFFPPNGHNKNIRPPGTDIPPHKLPPNKKKELPKGIVDGPVEEI
jgi:hypothetical protein